MTPILKKSSGSMEEITNYSGITLSSLLSTNDLQIAYKSKTSTIHCVGSNFESANYYVSSAGIRIRIRIRIIYFGYINMVQFQPQ